MVAKTATRPTPRSSHSHSHSHSHKSTSRATSSPLSPPVGQALPPSSAAVLRSPAAQVEARTPSPNYFGLIVDPSSDPRGSAAGPKDNWSPSSSIASFGQGLPKHIPFDVNLEFEAFRRQSEGTKGFSLGHGNNLSHFASTPGSYMRPKPERRPTRTETLDPPSPKSRSTRRDGTPDRMDLVGGRGGEERMLPTLSFLDLPRQQSPDPMNPPIQRDVLSHVDDRHPRLSLPQNKANPPSPHTRLQQNVSQHRADTLPPTLEDGPAMLSASSLRDMLDRLPSSQFLLLDLRVSPQFAESRVRGALSLCIPTTLLKRPSFNLQKLRDTFSTEAEKNLFMKWKTAKYIIVYDAYSTEKKDAVSSLNTLKKFSTEGWKGTSYILRGGFAELSKTYPQLIDTHPIQDKQSSKISLSLGTAAPDVAHVAGGCVMPKTMYAANPFFSNIRQNQDLIGGVGQIDVKVPETLRHAPIPGWLAKACSQEDHGKIVADKFLRLEQDEQARMQKALSSNVSYGTPTADSKHVQIAGIEKGGKNRYNNIWPFEHARVKLQNKPNGACDYVNASHIRPSGSNKRYIASQGPLPATFNDFWSVIWDHDVRVIVMLTAEKEGGQLKCHPYWARQEYGPLSLHKLSEKKVSLHPRKHRSPSEKSRKDEGRRRANTTTESDPPLPTDQPFAVVRKFTLAHLEQPFTPMREITQVYYSSWPDFGAPASADQLLALVDLSNVMQRASSFTKSTRTDEAELSPSPRPMLVHCSAGCGRTGTFCTIDSVIDMLKRQRKEVTSGITPMEGMSHGGDDYISKGRKSAAPGADWIFNFDVDLIEKTVEDFRCQRLSMVQTLRQYVLCYEAILEWIGQQTTGASKYTRERRGSDSGTWERRKS
ncbi:phosphatase-like protein [Amylocarpus encephaloides]|uniref:protein-tyrosine-phosphatase n=1 Tax=Amylocarpus encephaloides TaxID=45428 RepID=A0A9P8C8Z4_9HELO|nr:phosphatase-like protein [Amylocarpus encephaloides]